MLPGVRVQILAGAEGFEPPSPVLETGSLTVELTPLFSSVDRAISTSPDDPIAGSSDLISLLCAAYASGNAYRTSSSQSGLASSCDFWSSSNCALCNHRTAS